MKKPSLAKWVRIVGVLTIAAVGIVMIALHVREFNLEFRIISEQVRNGILSGQKNLVKQEVMQTVSMIREELAQSEKLTRERTKARTYEASAIAENIYRQNRGKKSDAEIQRMIVDALRPIRFFHGAGYYFITRFDGLEMLFADRPQYEGRNLWDIQDTQGRYVIRDMVALARSEEEGFYEYRWTKPGQDGNNFRKIAFIKWFEPYKWFIGTGLYVDDVEAEIKKNLLERISKVRYGEQGYLFASQYNGSSLVSNGAVFSGREKLWEIASADPAMMKEIYAKEVKALENPEGDYIEYSFAKLKGEGTASKISFVYGINELQWIIGAGFYAEDADREIAGLTGRRSEEIKDDLLYGVLFIALAIIFFLYLFNILNKGIGEAMNRFGTFFERAAFSDEEIDSGQLHFDEFARVADNANRMLAEKKRAQQILVAEKEKLAVTLHSIGDAVISVDSSGCVELMNGVAETLTGWKVEEAKGRPLAEIFSIVDSLTGRRIADPAAEVVAQGGAAGTAGHVKLISRDGEERQIADSAAPIKDANGNVTGAVLVFRDVTEERAMQERLHKSEQNLRTLFEAAENVAFIKTSIDGKKGKILDFSPGAEHIFGYSRDEALGEPAAILHIAEDVERFPEIKVKMEREKIGFDGEATLVRKSGEHFPALFTTYPVFDGSGNMTEAIGIIVDITKQKAAEEEIRKMEKLASIGRLAGGIAHDFNNMLTGLFGNISLARNRLEEDHSAWGFLEKAEQALDRATLLTNQLLTFSKGGMPITQNVDLPELIETAVRFEISGSGVKPVFAVAPDLWPVNVDRGQMRQVFSNLALNAKQAMPEGGVCTVRMENLAADQEKPAALKPGQYIKITLADQGAGIEKKILDKIFDPYFTTKAEGRGLGLATVWSIIEKHGGLIEVESVPDKGTAFTIYLPAAEKQEGAGGEKAAVNPVATAGKAKILVMDDETMILEVVGEMLKSAGYSVAAATDGAQAIELYEKEKESGNPFAVVIMDLTVPGGMGGAGAVRRLLAIDPEARVIASSGYAGDQVMADYRQYGFSGAIAKPFRLAELTKELSRVQAA